MKKITAIIAALMMSCAMFVSCGDKDSDSTDTKESKAESSQAASSDGDSSAAADDDGSDDADSTADDTDSAEASEADDSPEPSGEAGELVKAYSEKASAYTFVIEGTINTDLTGEMPFSLTAKDGNYCVKASTMGITAESYFVDGKAYVVLPDMMAYSIEDGLSLDDQDVNIYIADDNYSFVETKTDGDYTVEVYTAKNADIELGEGVELEDPSVAQSTVSYYFDGDGNLAKVVEDSGIIGEITTEFTKIDFENVPDVTLPDLTGYTEMTDDTELDEETQMKMALNMLGITEEQLTEAGYTYAQLAEMSDEELQKVFEDLGVDLSDMGL